MGTEKAEAQGSQFQPGSGSSPEEMYKDFYENAPDMFCSVDARTTRIVECNRTLARTTGYSKEEIIGRPVFEMYHPDCLADVERAFASFVEHGEVRAAELALKKKDGGKIDVSLNVSAVRDEAGNILYSRSVWHDISELRAEGAVEESRSFAAKIVEASLNGIYVYDVAASRNVYVNPQYTKLTGWDLEDLQALGGDEFLELFHRDDLDAVVAHIDAVLESKDGEASEIEYRFKTKEGRWIWCLSRDAVFARGDDGRARQLIGTFVDITERKEVTERIVELARFPSENPNPVLRVSNDGEILYSNEAAGPILVLWDSEEGDKLPGQWHKVVQDVMGGGEAAEVEVECGDRFYSLTFAPVKDSDFVNVYGLDITERRNSREEIAWLARFPSQNPNPVLRIAADGAVLYANDASIVILRLWDANENRRLTGAWLEKISEVLEFGQAEEYEAEHTGRAYSLVFAPAADADFVNVYGLDITGRKSAEDAARQAQQSLLERQVHEKELLKAELASVEDELIQSTRLAAIGQVSASIAHELRNPLGTIRNASYYLRRRFGSENDKLREYLQIIDEEVSRADKNITNLLEMARTKSPVKQHVNLVSLIDESHDIRWRRTHVGIETTFERTPFIVYADRDQLRQVFDNIWANAIDAMKGEGRLYVEAHSEGVYDVISFRDTGPGFSNGARERVFEPLFTTKPTGTGLGLTICKHIIEKHGGTIGVGHSDETGAIVRITLPAAPPIHGEEDV